MPGKHPKDYTIDDVCLWVFALGLGDKAEAFRENAVDGDLLVNISIEDLKELGLTGLQSKKVMRGIEKSTQFAEEGGSNSADLERINELENENAALRAQLKELMPDPNPPIPIVDPIPVVEVMPALPPEPVDPPPPPPPEPAPRPPQRRPHRGHVVVGAAGGATRGAILGAVAGAVAGDAGEGARMGAALGATSGAMGGLAARRRARLRGRY